MGPHTDKIVTAPYGGSLVVQKSHVIQKNKTDCLKLILFILQIHHAMETSTGSSLSAEEEARLGTEAAANAAADAADAAAAAAAAAALKMKLLAGKLSGNLSLPASSGSVHTANPPIPPSERSKLIRINRELKNKPTVLGGGGCASSIAVMETFHSLGDGRLHRSVLVEDMSTYSIATSSFTPATWCCIACSVKHTILPKKRNVNQWEGGRKVVILSDQAMPAVLPSSESRCPAILRIEGGGAQRNWKHFLQDYRGFCSPAGKHYASLLNVKSAG
jgi:hypothetical protein